jgi:hypothetical protein
MPSAFGQGRDLPVGDCMLEEEGGGWNEDSLCFRILRLKIVRGCAGYLTHPSNLSVRLRTCCLHPNGIPHYLIFYFLDVG